nr:hypothetical protein [Tanacetum cinerariifolium]
MAGFKMNYFKGMTYDEIRPLFEKHYNFNQTFLDEVNKGVKVSETEVRQEKDVKVESSKREGESLEQEIKKKQKMEEETEDLKKHFHIVTDDDDDNVYTDATPLASKIPIDDYKIHTKRNRPYFKIIRADGNHMLFISFNTMLKNFNREDLESLWKIMRDRFEKTKPKNYSDEYLLNTLKIMFEKPKVEAGVWKDQKGKYGLAKVEDESEMSLELLRLVRRQLNEGRSYFPLANTIPRHSRRKTTSVVESEICTNVTMAENRTMAQMLQAPIEELHQLDTFYNALNLNDQDALDSAAKGNFLDKIPRECLSIIESKSKVRYSMSRVTDVRANVNAPPPSSSHSNSFDLQQIAASLKDKLDIHMNRFEKSLNDMKNSFITPTAPLKAVAE